MDASALAGLATSEEALFRLMVEEAPLAIALTRGARLLYANPAFERMFGGDCPALRQTPERQVAFWCGPDGVPLEVEAKSVVVELAGGAAELWFAAEARREPAGRWRQAECVEMVAQLAAGVAQDFNNLLTVINGYSEVLLQQAEAERAEWRNGIEEIRSAGERAARLVRQLMAFGRRQVLRPEAVDVNALLEDLAPVLARLAGEQIVVQIDRDLLAGCAFADPRQLRAALLNLVLNARDAMPAGGRMIVQSRQAVVSEEQARGVPNARPGRYAVLAVCDTGTGMAPEVLRRATEPYFTTKPFGAGTGMGLAVVEGFAVQSGGHLRTFSHPGCGSAFELYLPAPAG
jgi:signal transduction histidine kinase